ncbi:MAG: type IX secretion system sortase PorU [Paludibacter sp.]|nr:type IX secretion system sortase PorU [Paludibacter sp.]
MKYKIFLLVLFSFVISTLKAEVSETSTHNISWNGVEKLYIDSTSAIKVISFKGAQYPNENRLPYFNHRITCDPAFSYTAEIKNPVYIPLSTEENELFSGLGLASKEPEISTDILSSRGIKFFDVRILPFVKKEEKFFKLQSFDLNITKNPKAQKVSAAQLHSYSENSVLSQGRFVKIKIANSGVYKLTYEDLSSMGLAPTNVKVFGYGGAVLNQSFMLHKHDDLPEVAISMQKGSDGIFNSGDYILFYAQGINRWSYDNTKSMFTHIINSYSNFGYYFVTSDVGTGKKIEDKTIVLPESPTIQTVEEFTDYQVHESEKFSFSDSGKEFYGERFSEITSYNFPFNFPNPILTNSTLVRLDVAASSSLNSTFSLSLNQSQSKSLSVGQRTQGDNYENAKGTNGVFTYTPQNEAFNFQLTYSKPSNTSVGYLNYIEVNARRQLKMSGTAMQFQNVDYLGMNLYNKYQLSNANSNVQIWDITDQQNISKVITEIIDGKLTFIAPSNELRSYLAIDPTAASSFPKPETVGVVANQNLHAIPQADMVIITHPNFLTQSETLAQAHREKDQLTVSVMTTEQVYNEFSSGTPDATAYRWALKMLYDRATASGNLADLPKYLLLFGKGTFDNRKKIPTSGDNFILTFQADNSLVTTLSYVTDDYFAFLDDNEGTNIPSHLLDIGVGRFTVTTSQQATDVVNKTIGYMNNTGKGNWKNQICFVADDGDGALHMKQADSIAVSIARNYPAYQISKIYLDAFKQEITASGESYPLAKSRFQNLLRSGLFLLNYTGHAGPLGWTNESILTADDVKSMTNKHLPLWVAATCDFVQFDLQKQSAGEHVIFNPIGGGIGILAAARPVYASQNFTLDKLFCESLFKKQNGEYMRVGDVVSYTKNNIGTEINKLSYVYIGDPAIKLNYPTEFKILTSKVNESTIFGNDTLRALSVATIEGIVADDNGTKKTDFNGVIQAVIYDKTQRIKTLNNHNDGTLTYSDRPNTIFSGKTEVKNGEFKFSFMLPKDIKYNYGTGRINYYAQDDINNFEAQGFFENFIVGGTSKNYIDETDGPSVQIYLNSENFVSGDKVNETPLFKATISDINGINTVESGIGHDISLTIDSDPMQSFVLNDYFQATANSYKEGVLSFKLPEMKDGKHTLTFRVWDLLNNSSSKTIEFEVQKGLSPVIFSVSNYPNPVKERTNIIVKHDRPETILNTSVEIFDLSGRKIWSFSQSSADIIPWDLIANDGSKVKTGIYLYRVNIKTVDSDVYSKTNKMLIIEQ